MFLTKASKVKIIEFTVMTAVFVSLLFLYDFVATTVWKAPAYCPKTPTVDTNNDPEIPMPG